MAQSRKRGKLIRSCILLCLLYFIMETSYFNPPRGADGTIGLLICIFVGIPSLFLAPVIALFQGIYFARSTRLQTAAFLWRLFAIAGGCTLNLTLTSIQGWYINTYGWFSVFYILAALPPLSFLAGGILLRGGKAIHAWTRIRTQREPGTPHAHRR